MRYNGLRQGAALVLGATLTLLAGCKVTGRTNGQGDVSIDTPFGGVNVKGDPASVLGKVGLPPYPGAHPLPDSQKDKHSADVNLSFGDFKVQVLAAALETSDTPAQVEAFYRNALAQYSDVITCRGKQPVGTPTRTGMGLTCDDNDHKHGKVAHVDANSSTDDLELKAGSPKRQHVAAITRQNGMTRIELISLELPHGSGD